MGGTFGNASSLADRMHGSAGDQGRDDSQDYEPNPADSYYENRAKKEVSQEFVL